MSLDEAVIVRLTAGTTTYHFGRVESICGEVTKGDVSKMPLSDALDLGRRLCVKCGRLVHEWAGLALYVASATDISHPSR